ncbi:unnamed protein product [Adineta ricciae]|uniref:Uncharacterized protein n=1 Tax=Adineta ricciae TaxID=249248 RepID=A0A814G9U8_ADIRI|nr:unnamed protein product [Adineta ricciae]
MGNSTVTPAQSHSRLPDPYQTDLNSELIQASENTSAMANASTDPTKSTNTVNTTSHKSIVTVNPDGSSNTTKSVVYTTTVNNTQKSTAVTNVDRFPASSNQDISTAQIEYMTPVSPIEPSRPVVSTANRPSASALNPEVSHLPKTTASPNPSHERYSPPLATNTNPFITSNKPATPPVRRVSVFVLETKSSQNPIETVTSASRVSNSAEKFNPTNANTVTTSRTSAVTSNDYKSTVHVVTTTTTKTSTQSTNLSAAAPLSNPRVSSPRVPVISPIPSVDNIYIKSRTSSPPFSPDTSAVSPNSNKSLALVESSPSTNTNAPAKVKSPSSFSATKPLFPPRSYPPPITTTTTTTTTKTSAVRPTATVQSTTNAVSNATLSSTAITKEPAPKLTMSTSTQTRESSNLISLPSVQQNSKTEHKEKETVQTSKRSQSFGTSPIPSSDTNEKTKQSTRTSKETQSIATSPIPSLATSDSVKERSMALNIVPVPSFTLRSTAVANFSSDEENLLERTQSIHKDMSIFKYHITQREIKPPIGNHTKATMFQMNTHHKQTPFPVPSLLFLAKNFNDGAPETDNDSTVAPTFSSLGLENNSDIEPSAHSSIEARLNDKRQQKNNQQPLSSHIDFTNKDPWSDFASKTSTNSNYPFLQGTSLQTNPPPLPSILKKPTFQPLSASSATQTNDELPMNLRGDLPGYMPLKTKAIQSISRSERLFSFGLIRPN